MFRYYGRKTSYVDKYPPPKHKTIIEPFAGSASYSMFYHENNVILIEKDEVIFRIWKYLIEKATPRRILKLPILKPNERTTDKKYDWVKQVEKDLIGFFINSACPYPATKPTPNKGYNKWNEKNRKILSENVKKIKHWKIYHSDYKDIKNKKATWFIDPPYSGKGGKSYRCSNKYIDYKELSKWVKSRKGQIIVCENEDHTKWLPFKPFVNKKQNNVRHTEMIYHKNN